MSLDRPLPGLDGHGSLCLVIRGVCIDHVTGALVPVTSVRSCAQFGFQFRMPYEVAAYARVCDPLRAVGERHALEVGVVRIGVADSSAASSNTLLLYVGEAWDDEAVRALLSGVERSRREGAGLVVVILFTEGALNGGDAELPDRIREPGEELAAPLMVNEDVRGGWTKVSPCRLAQSDPAWRLIAPDGTVRWSHQGPADDETIAAVLDERLVASAPAGFGRIRPELIPEITCPSNS